MFCSGYRNINARPEQNKGAKGKYLQDKILKSVLEGYAMLEQMHRNSIHSYTMALCIHLSSI